MCLRGKNQNKIGINFPKNNHKYPEIEKGLSISQKRKNYVRSKKRWPQRAGNV